VCGNRGSPLGSRGGGVTRHWLSVPQRLAVADDSRDLGRSVCVGSRRGSRARQARKRTPVPARPRDGAVHTLSVVSHLGPCSLDKGEMLRSRVVLPRDECCPMRELPLLSWTATAHKAHTDVVPSSRASLQRTNVTTSRRSTVCSFGQRQQRKTRTFHKYPNFAAHFAQMRNI
jgi:hypothetical protein